ncbi:MAG: hypothetical protein ACR2QO_00345 [Acidimicrobiales bacterium]
MKVKVPLLLLLILAAAVGYSLGTEKGRQQRSAVVGRIRNRGTIDEAAEEVFDQAVEIVGEAGQATGAGGQ